MSSTKLDYSISGMLREERSGAPLAGLTVRAFDQDFFRNQLLGSSVSDANGRYAVTFGRKDFTGPFLELEHRPDLFLQIFAPDGRLLYSSEKSVVLDAGRHTSLDINLSYGEHRHGDVGAATLFGVAVNLPELGKLSAQEILTAYQLMRRPAANPKAVERLRQALPGLFARSGGPPECGNGVPELIRYLLKERDAEKLLDDADADPFSGATVHHFYTANIVVNYTTDATLPGGEANPNALPAASATLPASDSNYVMPSGAVIGTVRAALADLDPANTEVAPTYIQKIGLLAEYALSRYINPPFSFRDPRGGATRLEFRVLGLTSGVAGYAVPSDFHMELNLSNSDAQNLGTVPHELFHLVQFRYNAGAGPATGIRGSIMEGGARLLEESINETPNRYVESAVDPDLSGTAVPRKGILNFPEETLLDTGGTQSLLRYAAGLLWKYIAEHHSTATSAADEPAIGVNSYRAIIERMTTALDDFTISAVRNGRAALPWYGTFDQFSYYDAAATELSSHETTWGNFLLANYFHGLWAPGASGFDPRFDYLEDNDPPGNVARLSTFRAAVQASNALTVAQGTAVTKHVSGHKPYAAVYYELTPSATSAPRILRLSFSATSGMSDPLVQLVRIGPGDTLVDVHRSDRTAYSKTINMAGLSKVLVIVAARESGGDYSLAIDEVAAASDVMVTRWNSAIGTEYEVDPKGWSWTWVSPDIMVDSDDDYADDTSVFFGRDNKLKVRLRNRGNVAASGIALDFWYQKATPYLTSAGWIPVQNLAGTTQRLTGQMLAAGAENWFEVDWCPVDDGTHHPHWCVKVQVTCATDPNVDNKMAFRNFANVAVDSRPDVDFRAMVRFERWTREDALHIVSRGGEWTLELRNKESFAPTRAADAAAAYRSRLLLDVPYDLKFASLKLARSQLRRWDGKSTLPPDRSGAYYPVEPRTLPPGVDPREVVTVAHVRGSRTLGGISYRLPTRSR